MEIKVTFRFDATDGLLACVDNFRKAMEAMAAASGFSGLPTNKEAGVVKAVATVDGVTVNKKERIWPPVEEPQPQPEARAEEPQPEAQAEPEKPSYPTLEDVRSAMHAARQRIEGEDYKDNTSGELYKKFHRQLTSAFKNEAALLGADKPSELAEDKRQAFIDQCALLEVAADGQSIGKQLPF